MLLLFSMCILLLKICFLEKGIYEESCLEVEDVGKGKSIYVFVFSNWYWICFNVEEFYIFMIIVIKNLSVCNF